MSPITLLRHRMEARLMLEMQEAREKWLEAGKLEPIRAPEPDGSLSRLQTSKLKRAAFQVYYDAIIRYSDLVAKGKIPEHLKAEFRDKLQKKGPGSAIGPRVKFQSA